MPAAGTYLYLPLWSTLPLKDLVNFPLPPSACLFHPASSVSSVGAVPGVNSYVLPSNPTYENLSPFFVNVASSLMGAIATLRAYLPLSAFALLPPKSPPRLSSMPAAVLSAAT